MLLQKYISRLDYDSYEDFYRNFKINIPDNFNFAFDVTDELAAIKPDHMALVWCDENGAEAVFTFAQLKQYSDKAANFFKSVGIGKGDPVMLVLKRRYEFWFAILGLHKIGAIAIPATHLLTAKDIVYRSNAADIKMIVSVNEPDVIRHITEARGKSPTLKLLACLGTEGRHDGFNYDGVDYSGWLDFNSELEQASDTFTRPTGTDPYVTHNDDILLLYFTSGTTGMPKMVRHNYTYPLGHILTAKFWQNVREDGLHLTVADTGWAKAAWGKIYGQWLSECAVFVYDYNKFVPKEMLSVISRYAVTSFCAPPTIYRFFIKEDLSKYDFSHLKYCAVAGEPLNPEVYNQFLKMTGIRLMEGYGQTELTVTIATYPWMEPKPGSMGRPSPSYDIDIIDDDGNSCDIGDEGQIVLKTDKRRPAGMFDGYHRDASLTTKMWHDDIYYTGDMAWKDEDGYFWFVGRADDLIKSSGYRIGPFEVESALLEHPAVLECAVTAVPDPDRGQIVKATIVLSKNYAPANGTAVNGTAGNRTTGNHAAGDALVKELQEHVKKVTAPYKYPRIIEFVTELPKTISGKIRRVQIREGDK